MGLPKRSSSVLPTSEELATMRELAKEFFASGLLSPEIKSPSAALLIIQKGRELGIPPAYALSNIVVIRGRPTCSAELMLALVKRDHGRDAMRIVETTDEHCTIEYHDGSDIRRFTYTLADAQRAKLTNNQSWQLYPGPLLRARCISAVARLAFPDSIAGMYAPEELGAEVDMDGEVVLPVKAVEVDKAEPLASPPPDDVAPEDQVKQFLARIASYIARAKTRPDMKGTPSPEEVRGIRVALASAITGHHPDDVEDDMLAEVDTILLSAARLLVDNPILSWKTMTRAEARALQHAAELPEFPNLLGAILDLEDTTS